MNRFESQKAKPRSVIEGKNVLSFEFALISLIIRSILDNRRNFSVNVVCQFRCSLHYSLIWFGLLLFIFHLAQFVSFIIFTAINESVSISGFTRNDLASVQRFHARGRK